MATDPANDIAYVLETGISNSSYLGNIRHWENLKGAIDGETIWIRDITPEQAERPEIQSIPFKSLYYQRDQLLFLKGSLLPIKRMRSVLLWSPLDRILPVSMPRLNHNFFGVGAKVQVSIKPSGVEHTPTAMLADLGMVRQYVDTAAKVRLQNQSWIGIDDHILLLGTPLLPIKGQSYWRIGNMLLQTGFDFEFPVLYNLIEQQIDPSGSHMILWQNGSYVLIRQSDLRPLSISSFRLTYPVAP